LFELVNDPAAAEIDALGDAFHVRFGGIRKPDDGSWMGTMRQQRSSPRPDIE
jgi:hypothetical protein